MSSVCNLIELLICFGYALVNLVVFFAIAMVFISLIIGAVILGDMLAETKLYNNLQKGISKIKSFFGFMSPIIKALNDVVIMNPLLIWVVFILVTLTSVIYLSRNVGFR